ncbi:alpha/beta hydrolase domain-containing protein [Nocardiopsis lambiniae]|uniref:Alpha/beta hydrolase domain-containing protein n=1 Tax=Nocardiopsis lambiniae TaxID=3075539 RepID=A0ABU2MCM4_9ACTN|nr:alpha/beta hydrolase domain-containing protein [Nocardiopsis sp. DSM 44743]MDT0330428.1 alpha/beta hydrolase domain-containing protein [Nocardiopsis sp. DSM 44743]
MTTHAHRLGTVLALTAAGTLLASTVSAAPSGPEGAIPVPVPEVQGPLPGGLPGDPMADDIEDTYPFFATTEDLDSHGYVEEEFLVSGTANRYSEGEVLSSHPYRTRLLVRRPAEQRDSNGTVLAEWQNVTAGNDLDALWGPSAEHIMRSGYTWVGVSAQHVGVSQLTGWSPARYGDLDVTDGGAVGDDQLSYDVFSQAAQAVRAGELTGGLEHDRILAIGASQSAQRMTVYYERVLPLIEPVFDGYAFMVGNAPSSPDRPEPVFQVLSETDVARIPVAEDTATFRRWEVAGTSHSAWAGRMARVDQEERDLGGQAEYDCAEPPFSRVPLHHVFNASYDHLDAWARGRGRPPGADPIERTALGRIARDDDGFALGGIRLSQVEVPRALNTGSNAPLDAESYFCVLFGSHRPFDEAELAERYPSHGRYASAVNRVESENLRRGHITREDSRENRREAARP